jgi:prepilin-type processing-associated H-X9-DG protein
MINASGFSLLELLVIIALISLLAAVLIPVLAEGRLASRRSACLLYTKEWSIAFTMYHSDNDQGYPLWGYTDALRGPNDAGLGSIWFNAVMPYMRSPGVMRSPADTTGQYSRHPAIVGGELVESPPLSYPLNDILGGGGIRNGRITWEPVRLSEMVNPVDTIVVAAGKLNGSGTVRGGSAGFGERYGWLLAGVPSSPTTALPWWERDSGGAPFFRHGTNFAFADGHARYRIVRNGTTSILNQSLPWEKNVLPNQFCAEWRVPSTDHPGPGVSPFRCQWW